MAAHDSDIEIVKKGVHLGAEVVGIDLRKSIDAKKIESIEKAFVEHELLIFRNQSISSKQLINFAKNFGELSVHPFSPNSEHTPELIVFDNDAENPPFGTDCWHSDETFRREPPMATLLNSLIMPNIGGDTVFASMTAAYEGLSDRTKNFISGLECIHDFKPFRALFGSDESGKVDLRRYEDLFPPVTHPVVRKHPVSGKPILFVNPQFSIKINGMDEFESRNLLDQLFEQSKIPEFQFRHKWDVGTVVIWDNRSTQHYAVHDYFPQRRKLDRVTIKGDKVLAFSNKIDPDSIRNNKSPLPVGLRSKHGGHSPTRQLQREIDKSKRP